MAGESLAQLRAARLDKVEALRARGISAYPAKAGRTHFTTDVLSDFEALENQTVTVAGRIMSMRSHGALSFAHIQDSKGRIQLFLRQQVLIGEGSKLGYQDLHLFDVGDFVQATGTVMKTQKGEISVLPTEIVLLSKSVRPLPDKWAGVQSQDIIRRKRYLQTIMEPERKLGYQQVTQMVFAIRDYLVKEGFHEFQTPILQPMYGGGTAKPFTTWLNAFDTRMFLAISHELYLKRLIIAGYDNVFTIGRYFRNEGVDSTHNPEFSMLETMSAYQNYEFNMDLVERLFRHVAHEVYGRSEFEWRDQKVNLGNSWRRISMKDAVKEYSGLDFETWKNADDANNALHGLGVKEKVGSPGEGLALAYEELVSPKLVDPTIVYGHPVEISPLAKPMAEDPRFAERFEIVVGGMECGDNWTEQNDPVALRDRWISARELASSLGHEPHPMDTDFLEALEYGMPPTTGLGPGLERMAMLFSGQYSINDVLFFPTVKPTVTEDEEASEELAEATPPVHLSLGEFEDLVEHGLLEPVSSIVFVEPSLSVWGADKSGKHRAHGGATITGFKPQQITVSGHAVVSDQAIDSAAESAAFHQKIQELIDRLAKKHFPNVSISYERPS